MNTTPTSATRSRGGRLLFVAALAAALAAPAAAAIRRDPNGVNVNAQGATSVLITFGGLAGQVPVEATWCGELVPAAPDLGFRCDPATIFGRLPLRLDRSRLGADGSVFTDVMSIPPSVARRAYQAAAAGADSQFFYVRRFASTIGGPDEYVFVTCRMTGGGARTPLSLVDVRLAFEGGEVVAPVQRGTMPPMFQAEITYTGTGTLRGRWEVVTPADDPPAADDLMPQASLPPELRALQRRYTPVGRFDLFLPPSGRAVLPGPDPSRLPTTVDGVYQVLLRVEASDDREADSDLALAGAGRGVVHAGAVAGFPMPVLRYAVGSGGGEPARVRGFVALAPQEGALLPGSEPIAFNWSLARDARLYRLEVVDPGRQLVLGAVVQQGVGAYRSLPLALEHRGGDLKWRVVALGPDGEPVATTSWRALRVGG